MSHALRGTILRILFTCVLWPTLTFALPPKWHSEIPIQWRVGLGDPRTHGITYNGVVDPKRSSVPAFYRGFVSYKGEFYLDRGFTCAKHPLGLGLGRIGDADEVFLNGRLIGKTGDFPPNFRPYMDSFRNYFVPCEQLRTGERNEIKATVYVGYGAVRGIDLAQVTLAELALSQKREHFRAIVWITGRMSIALLCLIIAMLALPWITQKDYWSRHVVLFIMGISGAVSAICFSRLQFHFLPFLISVKVHEVSFQLLLTAITLYPFVLTGKFLRHGLLFLSGMTVGINILVLAAPELDLTSKIYVNWLLLSLAYPLIAMIPLSYEREWRKHALLTLGLIVYFVVGVHDVAVSYGWFQNEKLSDYAGALVVLVIFFGETVRWRRQFFEIEIKKARYELALAINHDIQSPLATIVTASALLADGKSRGQIQSDDMFFDEALELLRRGTDRMRRVSSRVLNIYKKDQFVGADSFNASDVVEGLIAEFSGQKDFRDIQFKVALSTESIQISMPYETFEQCVANLLKNACEANLEVSKAGNVVQVLGERQNASFYRLDIRDSGPGFTTDALMELRRRKRFSGKKKGHGLGLANVQDSISKYGGHVEFSNREEGGAQVSAIFKISETSGSSSTA